MKPGRDFCGFQLDSTKTKKQNPASWCHFSGSKLCSSWAELAPPCSKLGERGEAAEKKPEKSLFWLYFCYFFSSESAPEPRSGKYKIIKWKSPSGGGSVFQDLDPGSVAGKGWDFLPGFLFSLCGVKIPPLLASFSSWNPRNPLKASPEPSCHLFFPKKTDFFLIFKPSFPTEFPSQGQ